MNEDAAMVHPALQSHFRLAIPLVEDAYLQEKWAPCKAYPNELYLRPDFNLTHKQRRLFRHSVLLLTQRNVQHGSLVKQIMRAQINPEKFFEVVKKLKYAAKARPKKPKLPSAANETKSPGAVDALDLASLSLAHRCR